MKYTSGQIGVYDSNNNISCIEIKTNYLKMPLICFTIYITSTYSTTNYYQLLNYTCPKIEQWNIVGLKYRWAYTFIVFLYKLN